MAAVSLASFGQMGTSSEPGTCLDGDDGVDGMGNLHKAGSFRRFLSRETRRDSLSEQPF